MSKDKKILPELRFPEFSNKETWANRKLSDVLFEHKEKSTGDEEVYSVSVHKGVINQIEHLGRVFAASNTENYKRVLSGDIIYTKSPTGDFPFGIIKQSKVSKPVIVSPLYGVFKPETTDLGIILDAYFEYPERTINYLSSIIQKGAKNTINIHNDTFLSKSLVLPLDKKEQSKIASFLLSIDELIITNGEKLELLKEHKKGLVKNLFPQAGVKVPKYRFKEFSKDGSWKENKLWEIGKITSGGTPNRSNSEFWNGDIPWVSTTLIDFNVINEVNEYITEFGLKNSSAKIFPKNTILMAMYGQGKTRGKVAILGIKAATNQACAAIILDKQYNYEFVFQYLSANYEEIRKMSNSGGQANLSGALVENISIPIPPNPKEQQKIASCLSVLDEIIKAQSELIEQLKLHKKGLMQRLFPKTID